MFAVLNKLKPKVFLCFCVVTFQDRKYIEYESGFLASLGLLQITSQERCFGSTTHDNLGSLGFFRNVNRDLDSDSQEILMLFRSRPCSLTFLHKLRAISGTKCAPWTGELPNEDGITKSLLTGNSTDARYQL